MGLLDRLFKGKVPEPPKATRGDVVVVKRWGNENVMDDYWIGHPLRVGIVLDHKLETVYETRTPNGEFRQALYSYIILWGVEKVWCSQGDIKEVHK